MRYSSIRGKIKFTTTTTSYKMGTPANHDQSHDQKKLTGDIGSRKETRPIKRKRKKSKSYRK